jgi:hypothetical protein
VNEQPIRAPAPPPARPEAPIPFATILAVFAVPAVVAGCLTLAHLSGTTDAAAASACVAVAVAIPLALAAVITFGLERRVHRPLDGGPSAAPSRASTLVRYLLPPTILIQLPIYLVAGFGSTPIIFGDGTLDMRRFVPLDAELNGLWLVLATPIALLASRSYREQTKRY